MSEQSIQIDAILAAARRPCLPIVPSSSGKGYSYLSPEGCRVGTIRETAEEKRAEWEGAQDRRATEFRATLAAMDATSLARQADYWLTPPKPPTQHTPTSRRRRP
jgi:hypothetical protein